MSEWSAFLLCVVKVDWGRVGWLIVVHGIWFAGRGTVNAGGGRLQCLSLLCHQRFGDSIPNCT